MSLNTYGTPIRKKIIFFIFISFSLMISINLFQMQILENPSYEKKSNENSIKKITVYAPRGILLDRYHQVVVSNKPSFTMMITPASYKFSLDPMLEAVLSVNNGYVKDILHKNRYMSKYAPLKIKKDVDFNFIAWYEENSENLPGVNYTVELQRDYSFGVNGSHMFGYTKEISAEMLDKNKEEYSAGDLIGYNGIEKRYEELLKGEKGYSLYLVNSSQEPIGKYKNGAEDRSAKKGKDLVLTIDRNVQMLAEQSFAGRRGALVAIEPATGEVLAFVSSPSYNLADFAAVTSQDVWQKLNADEEKPLFNRASMSVNSPGSTYKVLNALAALEEGVLTPTTTFHCSGGVQLGNRFFKCLGVHGNISVVEAIEKSCNSFFYQVILKMDLDKWADYSRRFGFGSKTNLDIGEEAPGLVPDSEYYNRVIGKNKWGKGWTINLGIGQGELGVTVAQLAKYAALVANNGKSKEPHFVRGYVDPETGEIIPLPTKNIDVHVSQSTFDLVKEGMFRVVNGNGSARSIKNNDVKIAGKTGTAQNPHGNEHALFVGFAPFDNPEIAVAVLVENVGFGSTHAAPIARDVIIEYLKNKKNYQSGNLIVSNK